MRSEEAPKKEDRRVKYTKMALRDSLVQLMDERPINRISITEICEMADINRATFYAHYSSQYDLLREIEQDLINGIDQYLSEYGLQSVTVTTPDMIEKILEYVRDNAHLFKLFLDPTALLEFQQDLEQVVAKHFFTLPMSEMVPREETEYISQFFVAGAVGLIQKWLKEGMTMSVKELTNIMLVITRGGQLAFSS